MSHTFHSGHKVGPDQIFNDHRGKSIAEGLVALVDASDIVASDRTEFR